MAVKQTALEYTLAQVYPIWGLLSANEAVNNANTIYLVANSEIQGEMLQLDTMFKRP